MSIEEIIEYVSRLGGVLVLQPGPDDGSPEIAWGDTFFYYAPDGVMPQATQPFATIVTKDYPGDEGSRLNRTDAFRVNVAAGRVELVRWTGHAPRDEVSDADPDLEDTVIAHPVYGAQGWLAVVKPGTRTEQSVRDLLAEAHSRARVRYERRAAANS